MGKIKELQKLLRIEEEKSEDEVKEQFGKIADMLFQDFHIEKKVEEKVVRYDFLEIEFYFYSKNHPDSITYPRKTEAGDWFPHYSGMDIAFKSDKEQYGGVLIRCLLKDKNEVIAGPLRCFCELCAGMNMSGRPISLQLVENEKQEEKLKIEWTIRKGIAANKEYANNKYCAYVRERDECDSEWKNGTQYYNAKPWERENKK